jgi:hypothetical protein
VKMATVLSQLIRIWRLCQDAETAVREIRVLLEAMIEFRHFPRSFVSRLLRKFRWWIVKDFVSKHLGTRVVAKQPRRVRGTACRLPIQLHTAAVRHALVRISSRLSLRELRWTGPLTTSAQTSAHLGQLLF